MITTEAEKWSWDDDGVVRVQLSLQQNGQYLVCAYVGRKLMTQDAIDWPFPALGVGGRLTLILPDLAVVHAPRS